MEMLKLPSLLTEAFIKECMLEKHGNRKLENESRQPPKFFLDIRLHSYNKRREIRFLKRHIPMAKKHIKRCSTLLVIRKKQIKTIIRYHFILTRVTVVK